MADERATVRPVTLARLVEITHICEKHPQTTNDIKEKLDITHRRARETVLEALRIDLLEEISEKEKAQYAITPIGEAFLDSVRQEDWGSVSNILSVRSPHYKAFFDALQSVAPADYSEILNKLEKSEEHTPRSYNQTSIELLGDWAERLGAIQRNAFSGNYYPVTRSSIPTNFPYALLTVYDDLEVTNGANLRQRYISIPELREEFCERNQCPRKPFNDALCELANQNVGKLELLGAPIDTEAKNAKLGIKQIELSGDDGLISTTHSTEQVMAGVEQFGKQYYYLAVHDRNLTFETTEDTSKP